MLFEFRINDLISLTNKKKKIVPLQMKLKEKVQNGGKAKRKNNE
jgi:hypothetical protein